MRIAKEAKSISGKEIIYAEATGGRRSLTLEDTEEALVEASKDGGVFLAVIVEWKE